MDPQKIVQDPQQLIGMTLPLGAEHSFWKAGVFRKPSSEKYVNILLTKLNYFPFFSLEIT